MGSIDYDLVLPGGANINLKMAGPTLYANCLLLNQLREHATSGDVPLVVKSDTGVEIPAQETKKPSVH